MPDDFCISCGGLLIPGAFECPVCGFDNSADADPDMTIEDDFLTDLRDDYNPDSD